jgi:SAM-dependent methyltransferase
MSECEAGRELREELCRWFDTPLGCSLQAVEANYLRGVLPALYGTVAVQLARIGRLDLMDACVAPTRLLFDLTAESLGVVRGLPESLPFDSKSVDVALLPHTLDFCRNPHQVLREVNRVLSPEGHVVIIGFNPLSLWGMRRLFTRKPRRAPWCANFIRLARIKDWLSLLEFEFTHGVMLYYRPPLARESMMERLHFMDKTGDRWWPMAAAAYLVVAKKRMLGVTPLPLKWKTRNASGHAAAEPAGRVIVANFRHRRVQRG